MSGSKPGERRGGRKKGTPNKLTVKHELEREEIVRKAEAQGIMPVEVMLDNMRHYFTAGDRVSAQRCAAEAAPYLHPRLSSISASVDQRTTLTIEDRESTEWLIAQLDRLEAAGEVAGRADRDPLKGNGATTH